MEWNFRPRKQFGRGTCSETERHGRIGVDSDVKLESRDMHKCGGYDLEINQDQDRKDLKSDSEMCTFSISR